jgi:hypothetical protein
VGNRTLIVPSITTESSNSTDVPDAPDPATSLYRLLYVPKSHPQIIATVAKIKNGIRTKTLARLELKTEGYFTQLYSDWFVFKMSRQTNGSLMNSRSNN